MGSDDEQFIPQKVLNFSKLITAPVDAQIINGAKHMSILLETPKLIADWIISKNRGIFV
jgi:hypothetical protein